MSSVITREIALLCAAMAGLEEEVSAEMDQNGLTPYMALYEWDCLPEMA